MGVGILVTFCSAIEVFLRQEPGVKSPCSMFLGGSSTSAICPQRVATADGWGQVVDDPYSTATRTRDNLTPATRRRYGISSS